MVVFPNDEPVQQVFAREDGQFYWRDPSNTLYGPFATQEIAQANLEATTRREHRPEGT